MFFFKDCSNINKAMTAFSLAVYILLPGILYNIFSLKLPWVFKLIMIDVS